ncbi:hypothetical protein B0H34DRAFT_723269 [Crassisporium funariophilum]|nr:hypothetical protein B0H34DRAFT_723269 [Crassisporium funariophilum]
MPLILEEEHDSAWKARMRDDIMRNLEVMLQGAYIAYQHKLDQTPPAAHSDRYQLQIEYTQDVKNLRQFAEEELKAEIAREEQQRKWSARLHVAEDSEWSRTLVHEQVAILNTIRKQAHSPEEYHGDSFHQGTSTKPLQSPVRDRPTSNAMNSWDSRPIQTVAIETTADREARLQLEQREKQQEEFRRRAEAIQQRKKLEKGWNNWAETMSSSSSTTSSSDQESVVGGDGNSRSDRVSPMNEEDVVNLVIFHDSQWTWISTLPHIQWSDFPWPVLSFAGPKHKEELTLEAVAEYIFAPLSVHQDPAMSKDRLMEHIRKWHPDRFEVKYLARVADLHEREMVREGAGMVARILNDLLGRWNDF